jgi:DNA replication protein DnaC
MDRSDPTPIGAVVRGVVEQLGTRPAVCPAHGPFESHGTNLRGREVWSTCAGCHRDAMHAEQEALAKRQADIVAREREEAIGAACIPLRFRGLTYATYVAGSPEQRATLARVRDYAERFDEMRDSGRGLVLAGKPGTGKTHLAAALALALVDTGAWVQYVTCMGLIRMVRETWGKDAERTERQVVKLLGQQIDLLLIDEVGVQYGTESEQHILFEILDKRYAELRPTILITNQDKDGFKALIGERVADRLTQTHGWLAFDWPSYRRQARAA